MGFIAQLFTAKNTYDANSNAINLQNNNYNPTIDKTLSAPGQALSQEQQLAQVLQQQIQGKGPNLGQTQLQSATDRNNQQAQGQIAGVKGLNPQLAARQILQQQAQNNQGAANQSAQLQQQQQLGSEGQLGQVLGQEGNLGVNAIGTLGGLQNSQNATAANYNLGLQGINAGVQGQNAAAANNLVGSVIGAAGATGQGAVKAAGAFAEGGKVPALVSPGEMIVPPGVSASDGTIVPGAEQVPGDSPQNDTVHKDLDPGTVVVPKSKIQGPNLDPDAVANFVAALRGDPKPKGYGKVAAARAKWKGGRM